MTATLNKVNAHAMLKWVIQHIEREFNALGRKKMWVLIHPFNKLHLGEICNIFNIVKGVAPCEITCKRFNPRPGYGAAIVTLTSNSVNEILWCTIEMKPLWKTFRVNLLKVKELRTFVWIFFIGHHKIRSEEIKIKSS